MAPERHSFLNAKQTEQVFHCVVRATSLDVTQNSNVRDYCHMAVQFEYYLLSIIVGRQHCFLLMGQLSLVDDLVSPLINVLNSTSCNQSEFRPQSTAAYQQDQREFPLQVVRLSLAV